jgi:hypothetical protein
MRELPILFSGPMVRALLDGSKTQTRRVVKQSHITSTQYRRHEDERLWAHDTYRCPHGQPGDRLWIRETWQHSNHPLGPFDVDCDVFYRADYLDDPLGPDLERSPDGIRRQWRPSIHMPRAASRTTLEVTGVRVERLQDISAADAISEGIEYRDSFIAGERCRAWRSYAASDSWFPEGRDSAPVFSFRSLWDSLATPSTNWVANPWVWVVDFAKVEP